MSETADEVPIDARYHKTANAMVVIEGEPFVSIQREGNNPSTKRQIEDTLLEKLENTSISGPGRRDATKVPT